MTATDYAGGDAAAVLLHGLPGTRGGWRRLAAALPDGVRLIAPDLLGFGDSDPLGARGHAEQEAEAVLRLLDVLEVRRFHLVGHDFGGPTALWMHRLAPHRVRTLALLATNAFRDTPIPGVLKLAKVPVLGDALFRVLFGRWGLSMMWRQAVRDTSAYPFREYKACLVSALGVRTTRELLLRSLRDLDQLYQDVEEELAAVAIPALVLWGDADPFFNVAQGERLAGALRAPLRVLEGCGHFVPQERPSEVAAHLQEFWEHAGAPGERLMSGGRP